MRNLLICLLLVGCGAPRERREAPPPVSAMVACQRALAACAEARRRLGCLETGCTCAYETPQTEADVGMCEAAYESLNVCPAAYSLEADCRPSLDGGL